MRWLPSVLTLVLSGLSLFNEPIQKAIAGHPKAALVIGALYALLKGIAPSPVEKP